MTDITLKTRLEGQRGYVIHTGSWDALVEFYRDLISNRWPFLPMLRLIEAIAASPAATQIHWRYFPVRPSSVRLCRLSQRGQHAFGGL